MLPQGSLRKSVFLLVYSRGSFTAHEGVLRREVSRRITSEGNIPVRFCRGLHHNCTTERS